VLVAPTEDEESGDRSVFCEVCGDKALSWSVDALDVGNGRFS